MSLLYHIGGVYICQKLRIIINGTRCQNMTWGLFQVQKQAN